MECVPVSALVPGQHAQCVYVRASRVWHYRGDLETGEVKNIRMVLIDEQGQSIYDVVPAHAVASHIDGLHETAIYKLCLFEVSARRMVMNPVENALTILFTPFTVVQPVLQLNDMFPEWTYRLTAFQDLPAPSSPTMEFLDVIGVIRGISNVGTCTMTGTSAPAYRRQIVLADSNGDETRVNLWGEAAWRFNGQAIRFLGQEESAVVIFVGVTTHMFGDLRIGSKELSGAIACRWYINVDIEDINILRARCQPSFRPIAHIELPLYLNLRSQVCDQYPSRALSTLLNQGFLNNQDGLFRCNVQIWRLTPGQPWCVPFCTRCRSRAMPAISSPAHPDRYLCSDAECPCTDATLEYHLCLLGSDGTGEAEFTLFQQIAQDVIGSSPR